MVEIHSKGPMSMCPMASMCRGMAEKPVSRVVLMVPGLVLILVGILILLEPRILVWLIAGAVILMGVLLLGFANFIHRMTAQFRGAHG